ncbi:glutathione S-transferase family protein [Massilia sp. W12]|uniref:glutathione S-transferase family protein n=1 Tax=Massilia sp. W12 TaxID=3126507 RepID=UPI0030D04048
MITLYTFGPAYGLPDASPFVVKTELLLKLSGLEYQLKRGNMRRAPKGKLPYIEDGGRIVADSTLIRDYLEQQYKIDFFPGCSAQQKALGWTIEKMLEEHLYWGVVESRWLQEDNFKRGPKALLAKAIPGLLQPFLFPLILGKVRKQLEAQGLGRHSRADLESLTGRDIDALAALLGDQHWILGDKPSATDATVVAFINSLLCPAFDTPLRTRGEQHANLRAYVARGMAHFYGK